MKNPKIVYLALVPMGGEFAGLIGKHSCRCKNFKDAYKWAENRFFKESNPAIIKTKFYNYDYPELDVSNEEMWEIYKKALANKEKNINSID